jgi:hypothetical protein
VERTAGGDETLAACMEETRDLMSVALSKWAELQPEAGGYELELEAGELEDELEADELEAELEGGQ